MCQVITTHEKINIIKFAKTHRMQQHSMFERLTEMLSLNGNKIVQAEFLCVYKW